MADEKENVDKVMVWYKLSLNVHEGYNDHVTFAILLSPSPALGRPYPVVSSFVRPFLLRIANTRLAANDLRTAVCSCLLEYLVDSDDDSQEVALWEVVGRASTEDREGSVSREQKSFLRS